MSLTKFQKINGNYDYDEFTAFACVFPDFKEIFYKVGFAKNKGNQWITLAGNNNTGFSIGGILNETELKKFIKEDLENGCVLHGAQGDINDLIFKISKIPTYRKPITHKTKKPQ